MLTEKTTEIDIITGKTDRRACDDSQDSGDSWSVFTDETVNTDVIEVIMFVTADL